MEIFCLFLLDYNVKTLDYKIFFDLEKRTKKNENTLMTYKEIEANSFYYLMKRNN